MQIIDFHAHIYPNKIAEKATNATAAFYGITPACTGSGQELLREGNTGLGTFEVKEKAARVGKNPRTGEAVEIAASKAPKFKAGKALKDAVK